MILTDNIVYTGTKQNFERDSYATLADMKAVKAKKMPSIFHAMCEETGKLYIYNKKNTDDEVLGKWREVGGSAEAGSNPGIGSSTETNSMLAAKLETSVPSGYTINFNEGDTVETAYHKLEVIAETFNEGEPTIKITGPQGYEFVDFIRDSGAYSTGYDSNGNEVDFPYWQYTLVFKEKNSGEECRVSASFTDDGNRYYGYERENFSWITAYVKDNTFTENIVQVEYEYVEGEDDFNDYSYEKFNYRREHNLLNAVKNNQFTTGTLLVYSKSQWDGYPEYYEVVTYSFNDAGMDHPGTKTVLKPLINKDGRGTITVVHNPYADGDGYYIEDAAENEAGTSETLFNNNGPELDIYSFTQGHISSDQMFETIGNSYYARYTGDYGRGNEPFIPGNVESRADSATVYIENAPMFGTSECRLFATNTQGQVFEGFFVTRRTIPEFTDDGLVWKEISTATAELLTEADVHSIVNDYVDPIIPFAKRYTLPGETGNQSDYAKQYSILAEIYESYQAHNSFENVEIDNFPAQSISFNDSESLNEFYTLVVKEANGNSEFTYKVGQNWVRDSNGMWVTHYYCESNISSLTVTIYPDLNLEETDTIDFSTWKEYSNGIEVSGVILDGQGGAIVDNSDVGVDPEDIEEDD